MAGIPGQGLGKTEKQAQKDARAIALIENIMDRIAEKEARCIECGKHIEINEIPAAHVRLLGMRYDRLRPVLASVTQETLITHQNGDETDILTKIRQFIKANPDLRGPFLSAVMDGDPVDNRPEKAVDAQQQSMCSIDHNGQ